MINYDYKNNIKNINVPEQLKDNIKNIYVSNIKIKENINEKIADFFVNKGGILNVLEKEKMTWIDWKQLKESCKSSQNMTIENNGILMEILSQYIIPKVFDIYSLIKYQDPNFETAENGNDILFFDDEANVYVYEVKSKISQSNNHTELKKKIKNAYTSLFCSKEMKNHKKISLARRTAGGLDICEEQQEKLYKLLEDIEKVGGDIISLCPNDEIYLNICIIGNGFNYSEEELQKDLIESINTAVYCDSKCANKDCVKNICKLNILNKSIILNIVSVEFDEELNIYELNNKIIEIIDEKGLDKRC